MQYLRNILQRTRPLAPWSGLFILCYYYSISSALKHETGSKGVCTNVDLENWESPSPCCATKTWTLAIRFGAQTLLHQAVYRKTIHHIHKQKQKLIGHLTTRNQLPSVHHHWFLEGSHLPINVCVCVCVCVCVWFITKNTTEQHTLTPPVVIYLGFPFVW